VTVGSDGRRARHTDGGQASACGGIPALQVAGGKLLPNTNGNG